MTPTKDMKLKFIYDEIPGFTIPCKNCGHGKANSYGECGCSYGSKCKSSFIFIGNIIYYLEKNAKDTQDYHYREDLIMGKRKDKRNPIDEEDEAIYQIFDLISKA